MNDNFWNKIRLDVLSNLPTIPDDKQHYNDWIGLIGSCKAAGFTLEQIKSYSTGNSNNLDSRFTDIPSKEEKDYARNILLKKAKENGYQLPIYKKIEYKKSDSSLEDKFADVHKLLDVLFADEDKFLYTIGEKSREGKCKPCAAMWQYLLKKDITDDFLRNIDNINRTGTYFYPNKIKDNWLASHSNNPSAVSIKNNDIEGYKYYYIEADPPADFSSSIEDFLEEQKNKLQHLDLPWVAMVYSGNKSIHTILRLDATSEEEFTERLKKVWKYLDINKYEYDKAVKNPSRSFRFPFGRRADKRQFVLAVNDTIVSYEDWIKNHPELGDKIQLFFKNNEIQDMMFIREAENLGYRIVSENQKNVLVKIDRFFIEKSSIDNLINDMQNKLYSEQTLNDIQLEKFAKYVKRLTIENFRLMQKIDVIMHTDTKDTVYLYYDNGFLEITKDKTILHPFSQLNGYIWKDSFNSLKRKYMKANTDKCADFQIFCERITGDLTEDEEIVINNENFNKLKSSIGYLISRFKRVDLNRAILLTDRKADAFEEEASSGGTGKGLLVKALKEFRSIGTISGRTLNMNDRFIFSNYSENQSLYVFDDIANSFRFESIYTMLSDDFEFEKKGKDKINVPYDLSPKVILTSNFYPKFLDSESTRRRINVIDFENIYNSKHVPYDDFGCIFFREWTEEEWSLFDDFIIKCIQFYLENDLIVANSSMVERKIMQSGINLIFQEFIDNYIVENFYNNGENQIETSAKEMWENYVELGFLRRKGSILTQKSFVQQLKKCEKIVVAVKHTKYGNKYVLNLKNDDQDVPF